MRVLWAINVYSRVADANLQARQIRMASFSPDVMIVTTGDHDPSVFDMARPVEVVRIPNSDPPKQQGNLDVVRATVESERARGYDIIVCAHADTVWTDLRGVERLIDFISSRSDIRCAATMGDGGFFEHREVVGIWYDLIVLKRDCLDEMGRFDWRMPAGGWCEEVMYRHLSSLGGFFRFPTIPYGPDKVYDEKRLESVMEVEGSDMLLGHDLAWKATRLARMHPDMYRRLFFR